MEQVFLDIEVYKNYFLVKFKRASGGRKTFEMFEGHPLDIESIRLILLNFEIVTFNGIKYDLPILELALSSASCETLKYASDEIIQNGLKLWEFEKRFGIRFNPKIKQVDLIELAIGQASLKIYAGRLHCEKMQDLPIEPDALISPEDRENLKIYCDNDLDNTELLANQLKPQIEIRREMSKQYGIDLLSKSDAQIAEAVLRSEIQKVTGRKLQKSHGQTNRFFKYQKPDFIRFKSDDLNRLLQLIVEGEFFVEGNGILKAPEGIEGYKITINGTTYTIGIGGLHSNEEETYHLSDDNYILIDSDAVSFYPCIISALNLAPENMGDDFIKIYKDIIERRVTAKRNKNKTIADVLKIVLNGSFGKFGSIYSYLFSPNLLIQTTVTGQLSLLMLIERFEEYGIHVVSANTDGIVSKCPRNKIKHMDAIIKSWENLTKFEMEKTEYKALYSRDVNSYVAIKPDGKVKTKGAFADAGLAKNPQNEICIKAVVNFLKDGKPVEETIREATDPKGFVTVRSVTGGAVKDDVYIGKAIRWYMATGDKGSIRYKKNGNLVPRTYGAKPLMQLTKELPEDVDYDWYIKECNELLMDLGAIERPAVVKLPRKNSKEWKVLFDAGKLMLDPEDPKQVKYILIQP